MTSKNKVATALILHKF